MTKYLTFLCPHCKRQTSIKETICPIGKKKKCKGCSKIFTLSLVKQKRKNDFKKILIRCPSCKDEHNIRVYRNADKYECSTHNKIFSLSDVKKMRIVKASLPITYPNEKTVVLDELLPLFNNQIAQEEITEEVTACIEQMKSVPLDEITHSVAHKKLCDETTIIGVTDNCESIGKYKILGKVGSGGFGQVLMGFDDVLKRYVAIKRGTHITKEEAQTMAKFNHHNIVQVYDFGFESNSTYIVMEYIQGVNINEYAEFSKQKFTKKGWVIQICKCFIQLAEALSFLHKENIFHSDIKPQNIMIILNNNMLKLIDLGSQDNFTYSYAAPEKFDQKKSNAASDIYSFGAVMFEILCGQKANIGTSIPEVMYRSTMSKEFPQSCDIDQQIQKICLKCLQSEPQMRYSSVEDLRLSLLEYVAMSQKTFLYPSLSFREITIPLLKDKNYIGRSCTNDIVINSSEISRVHALISIEKDTFIQNLSHSTKIKIGNCYLNYNEIKTLQIQEHIAIGKIAFVYNGVRKEADEYAILNTDIQEETVQTSQATKNLTEPTIDLLDFPQPKKIFAKFRNTKKNSGVYHSSYNSPEEWIFKSESSAAPIKSSPVIFDNCVYFCGSDGYIYAIFLNTGKRKWHYRTNFPSFCSPIVTQDSVYFGNDGGQLIALDATGKLKWQSQTPQKIRCSPLLTQNKLYFGDDSGTFYSYDCDNGKLIWTFSTEGAIRSSPNINYDTLVFGSNDKKLYGVDPKGKKVFTLQCRSEIQSSPLLHDNQVFIGDNSGYIYAFDIFRKELLWEFKCQEEILSSPVLYNSKLFIGSNDGYLYCLDTKYGACEWKYEIGAPIVSSVTCSNNIVYFGSNNKNLYAISTKGDYISHLKTKGRVTNVSYANNFLYATSGYESLLSVDQKKLTKISQ